ncbi:MAG TPA: uroporphyrinogen-III synthase, partial [Balneolaceae bacterium]|nr:uroporphyrinogen-III synthase [Balneolaceae bacterium]
NKGIPAVHPQKEERPVDLLEIMLRLRRTGKSLYPCGSHQAEELPGLLKELDIPVTELELFNLKGPTEKQLAVYQKKITENPPDIIIFHSRRSVNRIITAFPELDFSEAKIISADSGITEKLTGKGISVDAEAEGSWESVASLLL